MRIVLLYTIIVLFSGCTPCDDDPYGEKLILVVPMVTSPISDSLALGDTVWINVHIDKEVDIVNSSKSIRLDDFRFFTEFFISEISGTEENYYSPVDTVVLDGALDYLPLSTALVYPVTYDEYADYYAFQAGIVPKEKGLYWIGLSSHVKVLELYDHPAMYLCEGKRRRDEVRIQYSNSSTNVANFESMFKQNQVSYLQDLDYDSFAGVGSIAVLIY